MTLPLWSIPLLVVGIWIVVPELVAFAISEDLNKRGNPCGLCGKHHGAGPCAVEKQR